MDLASCLPSELQLPTTTITRVATGLSGAGVYRVEAAGQAFALKISDPGAPLAGWLRTLHIQRAAAGAGLAPAVLHADEARRAVLSAFVADRSFPALYMAPPTRAAALELLGRTVRRVHALPMPPEAVAQDPRQLLAGLWSGLATGFALPASVGEAVGRVLTADPPPQARAGVLSHNDINPTNLAYDGEKLLLLDWDTAGPNDPFYDLAAISVFLRMDEETCLRLLAAYDDAPVSILPERFTYSRRLVAALCGTMLLHLARQRGHAGETADTAPTLGEFYQRMRAGSLNPATAEGQWFFGLALVQESLALP